MQIDLTNLFNIIRQSIAFFAISSTWIVTPLASEYEWKPDPKNLAGIDGIGMRCVISSDRKFVHQMCKTLITQAKEKAEKQNLKTASSGVTWERNPDDAYDAAVRSADIKNPLLLEFFVRGTDGSPVSGSIHIFASIEFDAAVEEGKDTLPRSGRLVIWETAGTASGPAKDLAPALAGHLGNKLDFLFDAF